MRDSVIRLAIVAALSLVGAVGIVKTLPRYVEIKARQVELKRQIVSPSGRDPGNEVGRLDDANREMANCFQWFIASATALIAAAVLLFWPRRLDGVKGA